MMTDEGFVILAGSFGPVSTLGSFSPDKVQLRQHLIERGALEQRGEFVHFTEDVLMGTPSGAAVLICGRSANGWTTWKNDKGATLKDIYGSEG
jgi:hypothetical protein